MSVKRALIDGLLIVLVGLTFFAKVSTAYFCGFDDFGETHRAVFEDAHHPSRIFTTTHFGSTKYRPLNRLSTYVCWKIGNGSALPFRLRNLFFHLLCALCVYGIAWVCSRDREISLFAGLLFCLEPVANQTVVAAIFTNTVAYAFLLGAFLLFLYWLHLGSVRVLLASLLLILLGLFFYEPVIVVFAMMFGYLLVRKSERRRVTNVQICAWAGGVAAVLVAFAVVRTIYVHGSNAAVSSKGVMRNAVVYAAGLVSPLDAVSANQLLGTTLPPEIHLSAKTWLWLIAAVLALAIALSLHLRNPRVHEGFHHLDKGIATFLVGSIAAALMPFLVYSPHPSETYLYLPAALYSILLTMLLRALLPSNFFYRLAMASILLCFAYGTWVRNQRVSECGSVAKRILTQLPTGDWTKGHPDIRLANAPNEATVHRYGIYGYEGLTTIDPGDPNLSPSARSALQLATGNPHLNVEIVDPSTMGKSCTIAKSCFWVYRDGRVREISSK
jgi:hypothetical protein